LAQPKLAQSGVSTILEVIYDEFPEGFTQGQNGRDTFSTLLKVSGDEVLVSFLNLERLNCI
jgi:hypothetical protein